MTFKAFSDTRMNSHAFGEAARQNILLPVIGLIAFLLLIPVSIGSGDHSIFAAQFIKQTSMLYLFYQANYNYVIDAAVLLYGLMLAVFLFQFMLGVKSANVYFSLGISRSRQFTLRFAVGVWMLILPITAAMAVSLFLNISVFGYSTLMFSHWLYLTLGLNLLGLVSYAVTALICTLSGTLIEGVVYSAAMLGAPAMVLYSLNALMNLLLLGNAYNAKEYMGDTAQGSLLSMFQNYNPILFFSTDTLKHAFCQGFSAEKAMKVPPFHSALLIGWLLAFLIITFAAVLAFQYRKAELAGNMGKNRVLNEIVTFVLAFFGFGAVVSIYDNYSGARNVAISLVLGAVAFIALYIVTEFVIKWNIKLGMHGLIKLSVNLAIVFAVVLILSTGGLGYSNRLPAVDSIQGAEMTYTGNPNNFSRSNCDWIDERSSYYLNYSYTFSNTDDLKMVEKLHKGIIQSGSSAATIPYDILVKYYLKNGDTIVRYYNSISPSDARKMLELDSTAAVKKSNIIFKPDKIYLSNSWYTHPVQAKLDDTQRAQFIDCIEKDIANQTLDDKYYPTTSPLGVVLFTSAAPSKVSFTYTPDNTEFYITNQFTNTIRFLKQNNLYSAFEFTGGFDSIQIQKHNKADFLYSRNNRNVLCQQSLYFMGSYYSYSSDMLLSNNYYYNKTVLKTTDQAQISQLLPLLRNDYYRSEDGYVAIAKLQGTYSYVFKFLPASEAPQFVKKFDP